MYIKSLNQLIKLLHSANNQLEYEKLINSITFNFIEFEKYFDFSKKKYTRNLITKNNNFELFLMCWNSYQKTKIHNHSDSFCISKVITGSLQEYQFIIKNNKLQLYHSFLHHESDIFNIKNINIFHLLKNISNSPAISLHLYSKPIIKYILYENNRLNLIYLS